MPWGSCPGLTDADGAALVAYLQSLAPVAARTPHPAETADRAAAPFFRVTLPSQWTPMGRGPRGATGCGPRVWLKRMPGGVPGGVARSRSRRLRCLP
ncbi:hypothetical protein EV657_103194 [Rhodovulum visakhapatnamense]|uniref:Cytochrome c n=1 Tax=Rhodovulum visakhapatnamense TaxID=364297 RepID=A0A4R8G7L4_9RHOB|nr:hypothetical protein EV657_103194 [Rhodovulum visakhapatnamense]